MTDAELRAYLLGQMAEADAVRLEERLLEDHDVFDALRGAEDDSFDEDARGRMNSSDRAGFLARFGTQTDRLAVARALAERTAATNVLRRGTSWFPVKPSRWIPMAAAATLVLAAGGYLLTRGIAPATTQQASTPSRASTPGTTAVMLLTLGTSRAAGTASTVALPKDASTLELRVRLNPADRFDRYAMELRSSADRSVWRGDDLRATTGGGDLILVAAVPAGALDAGDYEVAVRGGTPASMEDLGFVMMKVTRTP